MATQNEIANVWLMSPDNINIKKNIKSVPYDFNLTSYFPNNFEVCVFPVDGYKDYYGVFFDAEDGRCYNTSAKWIAPHCQVEPTGHFIIMRKKWIDDDEETFEMEITPKEFKAKYLK